MTSNRQPLLDHLHSLRSRISQVSDSLRPDDLSEASLKRRTRAVKRKCVYLAISISLAFALIATYLSDHVFPDQSVAFSLATSSFTSLVFWYFLFVRQPSQIKELILRQEEAVKEWRQSLLGHDDFESVRVETISQCCSIISINNYYQVKDIVIGDQAKSGDYFITTREAISSHFLKACHQYGLESALLACIDVVHKKVISNKTNTWIDSHYGAVNMLVRSDLLDPMLQISNIVDLMVASYRRVTTVDMKNSSDQSTSAHNPDVISFMDIKRQASGGGSTSPAQIHFKELNQLFVALTAIVDPLVDRIRLLSTDSLDLGTQDLIAQSAIKLKALHEDVESVSRAVAAMPAPEPITGEDAPGG